MLSKIKHRVSYLGLAAIFTASIAILAFPGKALAACTLPSTNYGSVTSTINIPAAATYRIWSRMMVPDTTNTKYFLELDGNHCLQVGGTGFTANSWKWVDYRDGNVSVKNDMSFTAGNHTFKMIGAKPGVKLDRIILSSDLGCVPTGDGTNCNTPSDTTSPTVKLTSPASGSTVSGSVNVSATASDNVGVTKVEFFVDSQLKSSDTTSPYGFAWAANELANNQYTLIAKAYDSAGNVSTDSYRVTVQNGDKQAPSTPTNVKATANTYNKVTVSWAASTDNVGVSGYKVYRDNVPVAEVGSTTSYVDQDSIFAGTTYSYKVQAKDTSGNVSALSTAVSVKTPTVPDTQGPSAPEDLEASAANANQINLSWTASTDNIGVKSYDIYRGTGSGSQSKVATSLSASYGDSGLSPNTKYTYYVIARDASGNSSEKSSTVSATTPTVDQEEPDEDEEGNPTTPGTGGQNGGSSGGNNGGNVKPKKRGSLQGTVRNQRTKRPVSNARVVLNTQQKKIIYTTGRSGNYAFRRLEAGRYNVSYRASGYASKSYSISIESNKHVLRNVLLQRR